MITYVTDGLITLGSAPNIPQDVIITENGAGTFDVQWAEGSDIVHTSDTLDEAKVWVDVEYVKIFPSQ